MNNDTKINKFHLLGNEWIYFKIYLSNTECDKFLINEILPLCNELIDCQLIKLWFYVRYFDSNNHIRLRLLLSNSNEISKVLHIFNNKVYSYVKEKIIWKIENSIYRPELKRYGETRIKLSERLFYIDSKIILSFLENELNEDLKPEIKWLFALRHVDNILTSFKLNNSEKLNLFFNVKNSFEKEFKINKISRKQINAKYSFYKKEIENFLEEDMICLKNIEEKNKSERDMIINLILETFKKTEKNEYQDYLISIIHMSMNRIFPSENRFYELVLYTFLYNVYKKRNYT